MATFSSTKILEQVHDPSFQPTRLSLVSSSTAIVANGSELQLYSISTSDNGNSDDVLFDDGNVARTNIHSVTSSDTHQVCNVLNFQSITYVNGTVHAIDSRGSIVSLPVSDPSSPRLNVSHTTLSSPHSTSGGWHGITSSTNSLATASYLSNTLSCYDRATMQATRRLRTIGAPTSLHFSSGASDSTLLVTEGCMFAAYDTRMSEQGQWILAMYCALIV